MSQLHFYIQYIHFHCPIVKPNDEIRVSFTSLPSHQKGNFSFPGSQINFINKEFLIDVDNFTKEVLIIIRRKSYINGDPIIGKVLFLIEGLPRDQETTKELDVLEIIQDSNKVIRVGKIGVRTFFDNQFSSSRKIQLSYSMPTLSEMPQLNLLPSQDNSSSSFFQNIASKFKKKQNFVDIEHDSSMQRRSQISGSKSEFLFIDPLQPL